MLQGGSTFAVVKYEPIWPTTLTARQHYNIKIKMFVLDSLSNALDLILTFLEVNLLYRLKYVETKMDPPQVSILLSTNRQ